MADNVDDNSIAIDSNSTGHGNNSSSSIQSLLYHATVEEMDQVCEKIKISSSLKKKCKDILKIAFDLDIFHAEPKMTNSEIFASILYMIVIDARVPYRVRDSDSSSNPSVTDVLMAANVNINDLFKALLAIGEKIPFSDSTQYHFKMMKRKYCVLSAIFHTFQSRLCSAVFREDTREKNADDSLLPPIPETEGLAYRKRLAWVLFLLAKHKLLNNSVELFEHFQLLLCSLEFVLRNTPSFLLNFPYDSIRFGYYNNQSEDQTMLGRLADDFDVDLEDTQALHENSTEPFFQKLLNRDGELDCDRLCEEYLKIFKKEGDLNELSFLTKNSLLVPVPNAKTNTTSNGHTNESPQAMTPVRVAVSAVQQLNLNLLDVKEEAGSKLLSFYHKCEPDPSVSIRHLVSDLKERFLTRHHSVIGVGVRSAIGTQRWSLGVRLYQKVLEKMIITESERLPQSTLSALLSKEEFHKSMVACSLEVVLATYSQSWNQSPNNVLSDSSSCLFPWILEVFDLPAYDFYKVVESFIKAEPKLSIEIVKHLQNIEFQILDSLAWKEDSSLFDALGRCGDLPTISPSLTSPIKTPGGVSHLSHGHLNGSRCSVELFLSPMRPRTSIVSPSQLSTTTPSSLSSSSSSPTKQDTQDAPEGARQQPKSLSLTHFFSKVSRLGFYRLCKLCSALDISKDIEHKIWTCFEYCITKKPMLLKNRHLDQIVMCCIYGICKVVEHERLFKLIVSQYKTLGHARQETYKSVYIRPDEVDSIIGFYNRVFIQTMESYIKQFSLANKTPPVSPKPKQPIQSPTYSLPGKKNFYVSPMKASPFKAPPSPSQLTPSTKMLYSFGDSIGSSEKFHMINERMSAAKKRKVSVTKCLSFDS